MTQEEKQLLLQDLSARLPYGLKLRYVEDLVVKKETHTIILNNIYLEHILNGDADIKPYLRPMSSMTEDERNFYYGIVHIQRFECNYEIDAQSDNPITTIEISRISEVMDWLNEHHFDYRGLIEKGLALEAPKRMYNTKTE